MMTLSTVVESFAFRQSGYQMVDSISIRNFRSFREGKDRRLPSPLTFLSGINGAERTALLEALFLAAGVSPELAIRTRSWRGYEGDRMAGSHEDLHQALWADLFTSLRQTEPPS